jgi:serine/threonine-protein kinase
MSPEQGCGEPVDGRSDLYSLGIVGYYALTGAVPFSGSTSKVLAQQITKVPPSMASVARGTPRALSDAIDKCLSKSPDGRFATGEALADALAPGLSKSADVPVPLRVFTDRRRNALLAAPVAMLLTMAGVGFIENPGTSLLLRLGIVGAAAALPLMITLNRLRELARHGYGPEDVASALRTRYDRMREEFLFEFGADRSMRERLALTGGRVLLWTALGAAIVMASGELAGGPSAIPAWHAHFLGRWSGLLADMIYVGTYGGIFATIFGGRWKRLRTGEGSAWATFWRSRFGKWLGQVAATNLRDRAIPAERATELKIAMSAESLFQSLPKPLRESLGDVPAVVRGLQERAHATREQIAKLDAVFASGAGAAREHASDKRDELAGDVKKARTAAEARLSELVTALETVRLDLLRLQAGIGSPEGITRDLAAAAEVGREADRLVAGLGEADDAIRRR